MYVRMLTQRPYGPFADRSIRFGAGLTLAVGVNEAGKSTALAALRDLLWGIPLHTEQAFRYGRPALRLEARIELPAGRELDVVRRSDGLHDALTGAAISSVWQGDDDSGARWEASYGLSHAALREGGLALFRGEGDLAELVFAARTGQGIRRLLGRINETADTLYKDHKGNKQVQVRLADQDYQRLRHEVTEATAVAYTVLASRREVEEADAELSRAMRRKQSADEALATSCARANAADHARQLHGFLTRAADLRANGPCLVEPELSDWTAAAERATSTGNHLATLVGELAELRAAREAIVVDVTLLSDATQIRQLLVDCQARLVDGRRAWELSTEAASHCTAATELVRSLTGPGDMPSAEAILNSLFVPADLAAQLDVTAVDLDEAAELVERRDEAVIVATKQLTGDAAVSTDFDPDAVAAVVEAGTAIRADESAASRRRAAIKERQEAIRRRDARLHVVGLPGGPVPRGALPTADAIRVTAGLRVGREEGLKEERRKLLDTQRRLSRLRSKRSAMSDDVPTDGSVATARQERDEVVTQLVEAWLSGIPASEASGLPGSVACAIVAADAVADQLIAAAETAAERAALDRDIAEAEAESADLVTKVEAATREVRLAEAAWASLWRDLGRTPDIDDATSVRECIAEARAAEAEIAAADSVIDGLRDQEEQQTRALAVALAAAGRPRPGADLDSLLVAADEVRRDSDAQREMRAVAAAAEQQARAASEARDDAVRKHDAVLTHWRALLEAAGLPPHLDQPGWTRRQQVVRAATDALRQAEQLSAEAQTLRKAHDEFMVCLLTLAGRHAVAVSADSTAMATELADRLTVAGTAKAKAEDLEERIERLAGDVERTEGELATANNRLEEQRVRLGVADLDELAAAARRGRELTGLTTEVDRLRDLVTVAMPGADVEKLTPQLAEADPARLAVEIDEAERELRESAQQLESARDHRAEVREKHRILTTRPGAAQLRALAQEQLATLEDRAERYVVAHIQRTILAAELAQYERQHATSLLADAGRLLEELTDGRYVGLRAAHQGSGRSLAVITAGEEVRTPQELSEGTVDQVYLALRLAGIAAMQAARRAAGLPTLPVVLDDVLMTFDDDRAAAALRVTAELARQWQVIIFSHHLHLADVAESLGLDNLTVSRLQPPDAVPSTRAPETIRAIAAASGGDGAALPVGRSPKGLTTPDVPAPSEIRSWARRNGHELGDRGRIPAAVVEAYVRANTE